MTSPTAFPPRDFEIRVEWLGREAGEPLERAAAAEIGITLPDGRNLTKIEDALAQTIRGTARLSAHRLAAWFTANWWRLRWEPFTDALGWRMSHHMAAAGDGYVWPDIVFASDGAHVRVTARPTAAAYEPAAYLADADAWIEAAGFEKAVDRFVDTTVARLGAAGLGDADLVTAWREVRDERLDPEAARYRRLEAISGFDPDEAPVAVMEDRLALSAEWGAGAVEDIVAAPRPGASVDVRRSLDDAHRHAEPIMVPDAAALRATGSVSDREAPWTIGYRLAGAMRRRYDLGARPIDDASLSDLFGPCPGSVLPSVEPEPLAAAFQGASPCGLGVRLTARHPAARRFQLMRLIGGSLATATEEKVVPATRASTSRQKLQRAFAAEFLCPIDGLREILPGSNPDDDDVEAAAFHYGVSTDVVRHNLADHGARPPSPA